MLEEIYLGTLISLGTSSTGLRTEKEVSKCEEKSCELTLVKYSIRLEIAEF